MKKIIVSLILLGCVSVLGCTSGEKSHETELIYSNLADEKSFEEVKTKLANTLEKEDVASFLARVKEYNEAVENTGLVGEFKKGELPEYDVERLDTLWASKKGDFIGTNCRLNSYLLLKDKLNIKAMPSDDSLLFLDNSAIKEGKVIEGEDEVNFKRLFSKVKTEATKDIKVHAEAMKKHLANVTFDDKASLVSVVIHDNLDGDFLFIGHVGVLVGSEGDYLFVEKLSFQEPYQALKFKTKEACYNYLYQKYAHYTDETTAKPFIMDNADFIDLKAYYEA